MVFKERSMMHDDWKQITIGHQSNSCLKMVKSLFDDTNEHHVKCVTLWYKGFRQGATS